MRTRGWMALLLCFAAVVCCSCASEEGSGVAGDTGSQVAADRPNDGVLYCRYNLHYVAEQNRYKASYTNWIQYAGHGFLPYNTKLRATAAQRRIYFTVVDTGMRIEFEINPTRMGMSEKEYLDMITSPKPVTYEGLSDVDRQGIQAGKALVGMSKPGVMVALGFPARPATASPEEKRWTYWKGRRDMIAVEFDDSGKVAAIVD
jgi:hypothetical protein